MSVPVDVRVLSPITTRGFRRPSDLKALEYDGVVVSYSQIDRGPASIESEYEIAMSAPGTIAKAIEAEGEGADAIVIDCMGDPGLRAVREVVSIPVLGPAETAMHLASMLGHRFSVVTVMRRLRAQFENEAAVYGLSSKLASVRHVDIPVLALEDDLPETKARLVEQAALAVEADGAEAIIFGCTGLLGCAAAVKEGLLARGIDIPVIDPIPTAVSIAAALARVGLSQSKLTYPAPPVKEMPGYDIVLPSAIAAE
ncbi:aspartate/glutamate racemase family protein [Mesorhizobium sp. BR1-1-16]|uniref:aspartate/glutamate racemase family protein n=1 Tax=Mesorhizobium sp. BR1-1-16 TaxID=2876653 RepID=UPI001CCA8CF4|nr:aspartate/glutamate racemase family protein [Mesorhizobium sp. BR1-1-16]MBZ9935679.1 aspartate/glutamate racemase family protein [Mesorhizobium sp. BR1-1-16]